MCPLRSSAIMKGKITNTLKPPLTKWPSEVGYCELNEMSRSGGCLRQKKFISYLRWVINFWISEVKQYEETMANEQSQNGRDGYQIDKVTYSKGRGTLNLYKGGCGMDRKIGHNICTY